MSKSEVRGMHEQGKDVPCAKCGRQLKQGETYSVSMGNIVCGPCSMRREPDIADALILGAIDLAVDSIVDGIFDSSSDSGSSGSGDWLGDGGDFSGGGASGDW